MILDDFTPVAELALEVGDNDCCCESCGRTTEEDEDEDDDEDDTEP